MSRRDDGGTHSVAATSGSAQPSAQSPSAAPNAATPESTDYGWPGIINAGIQTIASAIPLPQKYRAVLPIPQQLTPRATADTDYYSIVQTAAQVEIVPGYRTPIWGYNGTFPGPTIVSTSGRRTVVTHRNELPVPTVVHLHGGRTPTSDDGYPTDYVLPAGMTKAPVPSTAEMPGMAPVPDAAAQVSHLTRDYVYPLQQGAATLWYHDHRLDFTGPSVYRGLAGFHIVHDAQEQALPLPKGKYDVPLMICDRAFNSDGSFSYPALDPSMTTPGVEGPATNGVMGDVILVNGAPWPSMTVDSVRYRFRILNASNARSYHLVLQSGSQTLPITQVGSDGGLLAAPVTRDYLIISPAERYDVVLNFGGLPVGSTLTLANLAATDSTAWVMQFEVGHTVKDTSSIPAKLSTITPIDPKTVTTRRTMQFKRGAQAVWQINGHAFDPNVSEATVTAGSTEIWTITSDFHHPVHLHLVPMQVLTRNGAAPGPFDVGWKDTVVLGPNDQVEVGIRFDGYPGRYLLHCHILEHEDMAMMANFTVVS